MAPHSLWSQLQRRLQQQLAPEEYETWFRPLRARSFGDQKLVLVAPNERFLSTLEESYRPELDRAIAGLNQSGVEILLVLDEADSLGLAPVSAEAPTSA
ncbi:MAG TPA: DnaA N-terminal domain-containing protein, partial [Thermoanaerobaculia bacterium]|nr:DnaA N-terminal domain-containing protein [Thermoanaerobaculia bacterium]